MIKQTTPTARYVTPPIVAILLLVGTMSGSADPFSYQDQAGRELVFEKIPARIAAITAASMTITIDQSGEHIVATTPRSHTTIRDGVLHHYFPGLANLSSQAVGKDGSPNIEELLKLESDLVLQWARKKKSIQAMEQAGLKVAALKYTGKDIAHDWLSDLGQILGKSDHARKILSWHDLTLERIMKKTVNVPQDQKPRVLYLNRVTRATGRSGHFQFSMDVAGVENVVMKKQRMMEVDAEFILQADPDMIWLFGSNPRLVPETILNNPVYSELKAVKSRRVYKVPIGGDHWDAPNQEYPLAWEWFARTAYPDLFKGSIRDSVKDAFPMLYGRSPTDEQLDKILLVDLHKHSHQYSKIAR